MSRVALLRGDVEKFEIENQQWARAEARKAKGVDWILLSQYKKTVKKEGWLAANTRLRESVGRLRFMGQSAAMSDEQIVELAKLKAAQCGKIRSEKLAVSDISEAAFFIKCFVESEGFEWPAKIRKKDDCATIAKKNDEAIRRVCDDRFWRRNIKVRTIRAVEEHLIKTGEVGGVGRPYVSNWAMERVRRRNESNRRLLGQLEAENEKGEVINLLEASRASIANPENRADEFMVRTRGFEEWAAEFGHVGLFLTLTCPSRFHAVSSKTGELNPKFSGATPREAMEYLNSVWQLIRAAWSKAGVRCYGLRIAEPHHDGCPHLHFWLFCDPKDRDELVGIFGKYAMVDSPNEPGAQRHRWSVVDIDPSKGSAAGYIAKYISKGLVGGGYWDLDTGAGGEHYTGVDGEEGAARVRAWASVWGIRQFQQIGSPSVGVWRELRKVARRQPDRLREAKDEVREAAAVADAGDWAGFVRAMGGALCKRANQRVRLVYAELADGGRFGGDLRRVIGVMPVAFVPGSVVNTVLGIWSVKLVVGESQNDRGLFFKPKVFSSVPEWSEYVEDDNRWHDKALKARVKNQAREIIRLAGT